ncbi:MULTISPECIES: LPXTG cell wall anchor domain-containing protein [Streptomyces]|uniref:LPXTG cell wall anchor domain-containing protein n=1 Tax=Streptomyces TaxID=1883 RepID=UPI0008239341|nr:LPXTG-motif cell wall anchor domain-containing protein [Streptomyces sp. AmelKG-D3]
MRFTRVLCAVSPGPGVGAYNRPSLTRVTPGGPTGVSLHLRTRKTALTLAQTGSDSGLPVIAAVGGVAILAGAGVVFALGRRRKADAAV